MQASKTINEDIAEKFIAARLSGKSLENFPGDIPAILDDAYRVQDFAISRTNDKIGGWKVGRIFPPLSEQFGSERLAGPIFNGLIQTVNGNAKTIGKIFAGGFGAAEAEFLLRIGSTPPIGKTKFTLIEAASLIDRVHVGIEIASSPLATINDLGPAVIISDFGNNNGLLIGDEVADWQSRNFAQWTVSTLIDDVEVGRGKASSFPDGPIGSAKFLFELMAHRGIALPTGTWISSGAVSGVHNVKVGQQVVAHFGNTLKTSCTIEAVTKT